MSYPSLGKEPENNNGQNPNPGYQPPLPPVNNNNQPSYPAAPPATPQGGQNPYYSAPQGAPAPQQSGPSLYNQAPNYTPGQFNGGGEQTKTLSILSIVFGILFPIVGLIMGIIAWKKANTLRESATLAKVGTFVSAGLLAFSAIVLVFSMAIGLSTVNTVKEFAETVDPPASVAEQEDRFLAYVTGEAESLGIALNPELEDLALTVGWANCDELEYGTSLGDIYDINEKEATSESDRMLFNAITDGAVMYLCPELYKG